MTKQFTTGKGKFIAVEVPEDAYNLKYRDDISGDYLIGYPRIIVKLSQPATLLFTTLTATEEDARKVVKDSMPGIYPEYTKVHAYCNTAKGSLRSLITSLGLDVTKNYTILKVNE